MRFIYFSIFIFFVLSCHHIENNMINEFENPSREVITECLKANPKLSPEDCNIKKCFSDPYTLHGIIEVTHDVISILKEFNVDYMINSATLLGAKRFQAPLPWDDDADLDIIEKEFEKNLTHIQNKLEAKGYTVHIYKTNPFTAQVDFWQIYYSKLKYKALLTRVNPKITNTEKERLWRAYLKGDNVPHLDIFPLSESIDKFTLRGMFSYQNYRRADRLQPKNFNFLKEVYRGPENMDEIYSNWYGGGDVIRDFLVKPPHRTTCAGPRFKDIRNSPETFKYMTKYLKHVFQDQYDVIEEMP